MSLVGKSSDHKQIILSCKDRVVASGKSQLASKALSSTGYSVPSTYGRGVCVVWAVRSSEKTVNARSAHDTRVTDRLVRAGTAAAARSAGGRETA